MDIWMIWIRYADGKLALADAWDDETRDDNWRGWDEAVDRARRDASSEGGEVRVVRTVVDMAGVTNAFTVPVVGNGGIEQVDE